MKDRILIYEDKGKKQSFAKAVTAVMDAANKLITTFTESQPWRRIETTDDFLTLYDDPLKFMDQTLISNIDLKIAGGRMPDPAVLASLLGVDRGAYMAAIGQTEHIKDADCPTCRKKAQSTIKVKNVRANAEFYQYVEYLYFINGVFELNTSAIEKHCTMYNIYAETPEQISLYEHWQRLCDILNQHDKKYTLSPSGKLQIAAGLKLQLSQATSGKYVIDNMRISEIIKYMK